MCADGAWTNLDANVACRQAGYSATGMSLLQRSHGHGSFITTYVIVQEPLHLETLSSVREMVPSNLITLPALAQRVDWLTVPLIAAQDHVLEVILRMLGSAAVKVHLLCSIE